MLKFRTYVVLLMLLFCSTAVKSSIFLRIETSESAILGSEIQFSAELYKDGKLAPGAKYKYLWSDNAARSHSYIVESRLPYSNWSMVYSKEQYSPGTYKVNLAVEQDLFFVWYPLIESSASFKLNNLLSGNLSLTQNETTRKTEFVSNVEPVNHTVVLSAADYAYVKNKTTYVTTYWFENCVYMGLTDGLSFMNFYDKENGEYEIEALVIGSFNKLPDPTTTTTSTPITTTTTSTTTTSTTTPKPKTNFPSILTEDPTSFRTPQSGEVTASPKKNKRQVGTNAPVINQTVDKAVQTEIEVSPYGVEIDVKNITKQLIEGRINESQIAAVMSVPQVGADATVPIVTQTDTSSYANQPFVCFNKSQVAPDSNKIYGYFRRKIVAKVPVTDLTVSGTIWLQHGDVLNLNAKCSGSPPFDYCIKIFSGPYNVTGNETCFVWQPLTSCEFPFTHYFQTTQMHSVVFVVRNPVAKVVNQVAINFYEAKKQSQLSVIVVPVSFSLVAVILVVFGVAYYIQNKNRFTVEVADFNFGETVSVDMEYKTFQQRLFESIREILHPPQRNSDDGSSPTSESSLKYGSMT